MYKAYSSAREKEENKLNIVPILDIVFILIFFLLYSSNFNRLREIKVAIPFFAPQEEKSEIETKDLNFYLNSNQIKITRGKATYFNGDLSQLTKKASLVNNKILKVLENNQEKLRAHFFVGAEVKYKQIISLIDTTLNSKLLENKIKDVIVERQ